MVQKNFQQMSAKERTEWLTAYQEWLAKQLPAIEKASAITTSTRTDIERGLALLAAFPFCRAFVTESLRFKNYMNRIKLIRRYADKVTAEVKKVMNTTVDLSDPALLVPHVGRPTKEEQAARALKAEQDRIAAEQKEDTLFGKKADIPTDDAPAPATVSGSLIGDAKLYLGQLKWLLSADLQEAVDMIRELRTKASVEAELAKHLALDNKPAEEVAQHTELAKKATEAYEDIYARVDDELARAYVRLKEDRTYIAEMEARKVNVSELRTSLRPYYDKVEDKEALKAAVIDFIKANDPEQAAIRKEEEEKRKAAADIIKYLTRKDKPNTPKRIETMKVRYETLKTLIGEKEAENYLPVLQAAIADCEQNVMPAKAAAKADTTAPAAPTAPADSSAPTE